MQTPADSDSSTVCEQPQTTADAPECDYPADDFATTAIEDIVPGRRANHAFRSVRDGSVLFDGGPITSGTIEELRRAGVDCVLVHLEDRARWQEEDVRGRRLQLSLEGVDTAPESVRRFVERLTQQAEPTVGFERRKNARFRVAKPILVVPVNENNKPIGPPFQAMTRDLSSAGVSFIHTRSTTARRMVAELTCPRGETKQLAMEVLRCRPWSHLYEIAGRWIEKLE